MSAHQAPKPQKSHSHYSVGWVCALPKEQTAAIAMLDERHDNLPNPSRSNDDNSYALGSIGSHNIVIACLPKGKIGTVSAASVAMNMIRTFPNIKFGLMVGIGGGIPNKGKIRLGDVVVGTPTDRFPGVIQWDIGKTTQGGFERTGALNNPPGFILTALSRLGSGQELRGSKISEYLDQMIAKFPRLTKYLRSESLEDILFKSSYGHVDISSAVSEEEANENNEDESDDEEEEGEEEGEEGENCQHCDKSKVVKRKARDMQVHYGLIASGNQVIKDAKFRDKLNNDLGGKVLCVEMEAAGLLHNFPCIVIRGICDYADSHKNKVWQEHAAAVAAAFAKELLEYIPADDVDGVDPARDVIQSVTRIEAKFERMNSRLNRKDDLEILDWLTPTDYSNQQIDYLNQRQQGTGEWLLNSNEYQNWLDANKQILFCPGIPGAGKTILTSSVINDLTTRFSNSKTGIAYIYCNFRRKDEQNIQNLLASLLKQLASGQPTLPAAVKGMYTDNIEKKRRPSRDDIVRVLESVCGEYERSFIVVDALDECQTSNNCREIFLSKLFQFHSKCGTNVFVTSRMLPEITEKFENCGRLEVRAHAEDVRKYLDTQISNSGVKRLMNHREEIKTEITRIADGMFLLAQLHFEAIKTKTSLTQLRNVLRTIPIGERAYDCAYEDAMARIEGQNKDLKDLAHKVLWWIIRAKRPITTSELRHALGVEIGQPKFDEDNCPEETEMASVCAGLVTIDQESQIIRLVHYTTQEYFDRTWQGWFPNAETNITEICVTYLSYDIFEGPSLTKEDFEARLKSCPLYEYAANYWGYHAGISSIGNTPLVMVFLEKRGAVSACGQVLISPSFYRHINAKLEGWTGVHLAAYAGVYESMMGMLDRGVDLEAKDSYKGWTPLVWAMREGREAVVRLLINKGANLETKEMWGQTPLMWAAVNGHEAVVRLLIKKKNGHEAVVRLLIERGVDLKVKDIDWGYMALTLIAENRHEVVIKLLIKKGVDLEVQNGWGQMPLIWAAANGHEAVVRLLIESGVDLEAKNRWGQTALILVAENGHKAVVRLLIERGADLEVQDGWGRTPLMWAMKEGHGAAVKSLIEGGADLEVKDIVWGQTPLMWAAANGHEAVVRLLVERGVDLEVKDIDWGYTALILAAANGHEAVKEMPLILAAENRHKAVVRLLMDRDADLEVKDQEGWTPLSLAAGNGHEAVVRLLMDRGADLEVKDQDGWTPLEWATENGHEAVVRLLMERKISFNQS
ncbi:hypothetical protein TWF281_010887 [Arthrobotrys megalospora]